MLPKLSFYTHLGFVLPLPHSLSKGQIRGPGFSGKVGRTLGWEGGGGMSCTSLPYVLGAPTCSAPSRMFPSTRYFPCIKWSRLLPAEHVALPWYRLPMAPREARPTGGPGEEGAGRKWLPCARFVPKSHTSASQDVLRVIMPPASHLDSACLCPFPSGDRGIWECKGTG